MSSGFRDGIGGRSRAAICAVAKNEGIYLHEWIAYHRLLGFDEILVYDNESTDGSVQLLDELSKHGLVTPVPWSVGDHEAAQFTAYVDGAARLGAGFGWVAFIDLDEFLVLPRHDTIADFLAEFETLDAIGVNWKNFGSSGLERYEPRPVIDRFRRCSWREHGRNRRVKPLVRTAVMNRPGRPHTPKVLPPARYVDITGEKVRNGETRLVHHETIRLNHYYTKSREEWEWKRARGRGGKPTSLPERKHWYPEFELRDRNEDVEEDIVKRLPALLELMERTRARRAVVQVPPASSGRP
jgi:Glycosyltransferase family 92